MDNEISRWSDLWTTQADDHVLVRTNQGGDPCRLIIFNTRTRTIDCIEDDALYFQILDEMQKAGVPVVDQIPADPKSIDQIIDEMFAAGKSIAEINEKRREWIRGRTNGKDA